MSNALDDAPRLPARPSVADAIRWFELMTKFIGVGFHPDTAIAEYVNPMSGARSFTPVCAANLQRQLDVAHDVLASAGVDPCEAASEVQRELMASLMG